MPNVSGSRANENFAAFARIYSEISLVILATGFWLMGLTAILHRPVSRDGVKVSSTGCVIGGCASMATGGIFSVAALLHRRRPSATSSRAAYTIIARNGHKDSSPSERL